MVLTSQPKKVVAPVEFRTSFLTGQWKVFLMAAEVVVMAAEAVVGQAEEEDGVDVAEGGVIGNF